VDHTSGIAVKEGTVFQPVIKKGVSVSKLTNADDFIERASKYCLTTQEQDSFGEVETKLYKVLFDFLFNISLISKLKHINCFREMS
jgi:kinesin family protein 23